MRFTLVVYVSHKVNVLVTDFVLNITSQEHLIFTSLHIGSRLFELFSKEVRVKKQPGMPLTFEQQNLHTHTLQSKRPLQIK